MNGNLHPLNYLQPPHPHPPAVTVKVTESNAVCEGSALFIFHHRTAGVEDVPSEGDQCMMSAGQTGLAALMGIADEGKSFIYSGSSLINIIPEV